MEFEELFLKYDQTVQFQYLKSFRRVRVIFSSTENAKQAHANLNNSEIRGQPFRCYFAQVSTIKWISQQEVSNRRREIVPIHKYDPFTGRVNVSALCSVLSIQIETVVFDIALLLIFIWSNVDNTELLCGKDLLKIQLHVNYLPRAWWLLLGHYKYVRGA